ncbi:MAG TPA: shikimate kinase [Phycisphaerae bacterium]|nr:shikimate kinase [Phycisphaerae bacterium]
MSGVRGPGDTPAAADRPGRDNLILIGLRGSGKSAVARLLAERLGWNAVDADELIERQSGHTIREIFERDGEAGFRTLETQVLERVVRGKRQVISVGGGAILSQHNRQLLRQAGVCIWLTAPPEVLHRRLQADTRTASLRPPLTDMPGLEEIRQVLQTREPLYAATAEHVVDTTDRTVAQVADAVVALVSSLAGPAKGT